MPKEIKLGKVKDDVNYTFGFSRYPVSYSSGQYMYNDSFTGYTLFIGHNTAEFVEITDMIDAELSDIDVENYLRILIVNHLDIEELKDAIDERLHIEYARGVTEGRKSKADEIKNALEIW